ncbi:trimethylamine methyltransferase [Desulfoluna butyratoxydans]|uniref:Trimethylamine methyltransferase n=2 Tax=Desulfoluna butyratoxydans TaxID=231438 RepID=A0A4U8YQL4_9BACT|nr:trimethylamine methyltransferase [Desulfoluna butyratoxydans]
MLKSNRFRLADDEMLDQIHEATVEVLETCGVDFEDETARQIMKDGGCEVDGWRIKIPRAILEKTIDQAPSSFMFHGRNEEKSFLVGEGQTRPHTDPSFGAVRIHDIKTGYRDCTMDDLTKFFTLIQSSDICDIGGGWPVEPADIPEKKPHLHVFREMVRHTDKPLRSFVGTTEEVREYFELFEIAKGEKGYLDTHTCMFASINPVSPLTYAAFPLQTMIEHARKKQAICTLTCAMSGISAPMSIMGAAVMQNAEMLAGNVLLQLVNPGTPYIMGPASCRPDMKSGLYANGSPEANMINGLSIQMAVERYKIPVRIMAGITDAKVVDAQAGMETMQTLIHAVMAGAHWIHGCFGSLDSLNATSFEKIMLGEEAFSRVLRLLEGLREWDKDTTVSEIVHAGPRGTYFMEPTTVTNFRNTWRPTVSTQEAYQNWADAGAKDFSTMARERWEKLLAEAPESLLDADREKAVNAFVEGKLSEA